MSPRQRQELRRLHEEFIDTYGDLPGVVSVTVRARAGVPYLQATLSTDVMLPPVFAGLAVETVVVTTSGA
jgi:hypothetical protein